MTESDEPRTIRTDAELAQWGREHLVWLNERLREAEPGGQMIYAPQDIATMQKEAEMIAVMLAMLEADGF